jgi:hypothetical protein
MTKLLAAAGALAFILGAQPMNRVELKLDSSEAEAVLNILDRRAEQKPVTGADWQTLVSTIPYQRLKKRETSMGRSFADADFQRFVVTLDTRRDELRLRRTAPAPLPAGRSDASCRGLSGHQASDKQLRL